jgi:hypothetical protein
MGMATLSSSARHEKRDTRSVMFCLRPSPASELTLDWNDVSAPILFPTVFG